MKKELNSMEKSTLIFDLQSHKMPAIYKHVGFENLV